MFNRSFCRTLAAAAAMIACAPAALADGHGHAHHAKGVYAGVGFPGAFVGFSLPLTDRVGVRADYATMGSFNESVVEDDIRYEGKGKISRFGVFGDYYVLGGLRLTGGVTVNNVKFDLTGRSETGAVNIGGTVYDITEDGRVDVQVKFPKVTPYVGFGYGYAPKAGKGWGFAFDIGASIGKPKVSGTVRIPPSGGVPVPSPVTQEDLDRELDEIRDDVAKIKFLPQVSVSVNYRF